MGATRSTRALGLAAGLVLAAVFDAHVKSAQPSPPASLLARHAGFEENRGQSDARVRFLSRGPRDTLFLTDDEAVLALKGPTGTPALRMRVLGASTGAGPHGVDPLPSLTYYARADTRGPLEAARAYRRVRYEAVYPGIDLEYYRTGRHIEFDFHLAPEADPGQIELAFPGVDAIARDAGGNLVLHTGDARIVLKRPVAFQEGRDGRQDVPSDYMVAGDRVRFALGDYDQTRALTIDPIIEYATYLGGTGDDEVIGAELDDEGNLYVFGRTGDGPGFPRTDVVPAQQAIDPVNCFVSKITADGTALEASVVFEGFGICEAFEVDGLQVHVAMQAMLGDFGGFAQIRTLTFGVPTLVTSLKNGELSQIAGRPTQIEDIRTDGFGNTYLLYHQLVQGDAELQARLLKVNAAGSIVGTHDLGVPSQQAPSARAMAVDNFGQVFVVGSTSGAIVPSADAFQSTPPTIFSCAENGFLIRVDTSVEPYAETYSTYIAGNGCDTVLGIVRDPLGSVYLTGRSASDDLPAIGDRWTGGPGGDAFMMKFDVAPGGGPTFSAGRFLGLELGSGSQGVRDVFHPLVRLPTGELAFTGAAAGATFPLWLPLFDATSAVGFPRFLQLLSPLDFDDLFSTHLDATGDAAHALAAGATGTGLPIVQPFVFAITETPEDGHGTAGSLQPLRAGGLDVLTRRIDLTDVVSNTAPTFDLGQDRSIEAADASGADFDLSCAWCSLTDFSDSIQQLIWTIDGVRYVLDEPFVGQVTLPIGAHQIELVVTDTLGAATIDTLVLTVDPPDVNLPPAISLGPDLSVTATSPDGIQLYLPGMVSDPDNDVLDLTWTAATTTVQLTVSPPYFPRNAAALVRLPIGTHLATLSVSDRNGPIVEAQVTIDVSGLNTMAGFGVVATPADDTRPQAPSFTQGRVTMTFEQVTAPGLTWLSTRTDQVPPAPTAPQALQPGSAPLYYDVATTASSEGAVRVCLDTTGMSFVDRAGARVHRWDGSLWVDVTAVATPAEAAANLLCGQLASAAELGTFAIFTPADESTRVRTVVGNGNPFVPGAPAPGDGGSAAQAPVGAPRTMVFDMPRQAAYVGDGARIRRVDLRTNTISTFAGTGSFGNIASEVDGADALTVDIWAGEMAVDRNGNLFIPGVNGCSVLRVDRETRQIRRVAGLGPDPATLSCRNAGDGGPAIAADINVSGGMVFDADGNLFFTQTIFGEAGTGSGKAIRRIAAGPDHLITGDDAAETIGTVAGGGIQWPPQAGDPRLALIDASDLAFNQQGDLYIGGTAFVVRVTPAAGASVIDGRAGELLSIVAGQSILTSAPYQGDGGPALDANLNGPRGIDILPNGDLLIADSSANRIRLVTAGADGVVDGEPDEAISTVAGFNDNIEPPLFNGDGFALATTFSYPMDVVVDPRGGFNIVDTGFNRVRHVGPPPLNQAPVANAGPDQEVPSMGGDSELVHLDGRASSDADGDALTYEWTEGGTALGSGAEVDVVLAPGPHTITLTVTDTAGNSSSDTVTVTVVVDTNEADISVSVSTPSTMVPGPNDLTLTVTLSNLGPSNVSTARISATLPAGLQFVSADGADVCEWPAGVCDFGGVTAGGSRTVHIVVRPTGLGTFTATFVGSAPINDPVLANNTASVTITAGLLVSEVIRVTDTVTPRTAVLLPPIVETIQVTDTPTPQAAVMVPVHETIRVADTPGAVTGVTLVALGDTLYQAASADGTNQPIHAAFAEVLQAGFLFAEILSTPPLPPAGTEFIGAVLDLTTTATYSGPVTVCMDGTFVAGDRLVHFENGAWIDITTGAGPTATRICGEAASLSPFAAVRVVNRPPAADAGVYPPVEATSPSGAAVTLAGTGTDPDAGDMLTFLWTEGGLTLGTSASLAHTFAVGVHAVSLTVSDRAGATATDTTTVTVVDTTPPVVLPPPALSVPALRIEGTRVSEWPALAEWLAAATAVDLVDATPAGQAPTLNGSPIGPGTLFPMGTSTVTFSFTDARGNRGSATSVVHVAVGTPRVEVQLLGSGPLGSGRHYVDLAFANVGDGIARHATALVLPVTVKGFGFSRLLTRLPLAIGDLSPGQSRTIRIVLQVPSRVTEIVLYEVGAFAAVDGRIGGFAGRQLLRP